LFLDFWKREMFLREKRERNENEKEETMKKATKILFRKENVLFFLLGRTRGEGIRSTFHSSSPTLASHRSLQSFMMNAGRQL
jgi:hypothetical protein